MPLVSVIIPVYNVEQYLRQCLDSVVNQTLKDIEIICVNDGSTDNSLQILEEYAKKDNRIKIFNKKNGGLSSARNEGLKYVTSKYVGFIDSDDYIEPETYQKAYEIMNQHNVDIVSWGANIIAEDNDYNSPMVKSAIKYHKIKLEGLHKWNYSLYNQTTVTVWNKLFKYSIINNFNISFPEGILHEDNEFFAKYLLHCKNIYYINIYFYNYLQRKNSIMGRQFSDKKANNRLSLIDVYKNIYTYYKQYNALEENRELLNIIFNNTLWDSYVLSYDKKLAIHKIKQLAKILNNNILQNNNLKLIQQNKISKIPYIDINTPLENIFSIKNKDTKKQITFLGIKIKIKSKKLEEKIRYQKFEQKIDKLICKIDKLDKILSQREEINAKN